MAEKINIWDGVIYRGKYSSGISLYTDNDSCIYYVIPLIIGHTYKVIFNESHNRRRVMTTTSNPSTSMNSGVRSLVETSSPPIPYTLDFVAQTNENFLFVYVSNQGETPKISVHDMSVPDYNSKYLLRSDGAIYTISDESLVMLEIEYVSSVVFEEYGFDELPEWSIFSELVNPEILYWQDVMDALPTITATMTATPFTPQTVVSPNYDMSDSTILGVECAYVTASSDVVFAISVDDGVTWYMWTGETWGILTDATTGMSADTINAITTEQWAGLTTTGQFKVRMTLFDENSSFTSFVMDYIN